VSGAALEAPASGGLIAGGPVANARPRRRLPGRALLVLGTALLAAAGGALYIVTPHPIVTTDDAYLRADVSTISPRVRGLIETVAVQDNQRVHAGDILARIDPEEYQARLAVAEGEVAAARATVAAQAASLAKLDAEQRLAAANVRATETGIRSADAEDTRASLDRARFDQLASTGAVAKRDADRARATAQAARADADRSRAALAVSRAQEDVTAGRRAELLAASAQAHAALSKAQAALDLAGQDARHAIIRSPVDGVVGDRQVQAGDYVQPGTALMTIVPMATLYVTANFKETQVTRMRPGQTATVAIDAFGSTTFKAEVDSIAPGSGSQFALLPFEPGTGNFTKIVRRVPVRIRLLPGAGIGSLRPGLSAVVSVDTGS
jgi:membrane fusion protein (multidrug efflux system)